MLCMLENWGVHEACSHKILVLSGNIFRLAREIVSFCATPHDDFGEMCQFAFLKKQTKRASHTCSSSD